MASGEPDAEAPRESDVLSRIARLTTGRPRLVVGAWLLVMLSLAGLGLGAADRLVTQPIYVNGSESKHAHELVLREFGNEEAFIVVLRGPADEVEAQGRRLAERIDACLLYTSPSPRDRTRYR